MTLEELEAKVLEQGEQIKGLQAENNQLKADNTTLSENNKSLQDYNNKLFMKVVDTKVDDNNPSGLKEVESEEEFEQLQVDEILKLCNDRR